MRARQGEFGGNDRFELQSRLGSGATGVVYCALDRSTGERVALKVLREVHADAVADFKGEFRAAADLEHPNLVELRELIADGDSWLFTMELVDGVDFMQWVRPEGDRFDVQRLRSALAQLATALQVLHDNGQVHRDVKPSNVLVRGDGSVKLLDFGLVTAAHTVQIEEDGPAVGTTAYVAPEQAAGEGVGPAADWYAVGAMLYEALTGRLPFDGPPLKILMDKQTEVPPHPKEIQADVDERLAELCMQLLRANPDRRPTGDRVVRKLSGPRRSAITQPTRSQIFFGRERELGALLDAARRGFEKGPAVVLIVGPTGIGRSALLAQAARLLKTEGCVAFGRCRADEQVPYRALDGVLDELSERLRECSSVEIERVLPRRPGLLGQVFPALTRVSAIATAPLTGVRIPDLVEQRRRAFVALRELLTAMAREQPVTLIIDDLHWADADSLDVLRELCNAAGEAPHITIIGSVDSDATSQDDSLSLDSPQLSSRLQCPVEHLPLGELDPDSALSLAAYLLQDGTGDLSPLPTQADAPSQADDVAAEAAGHPRLIEELAHHVREHGMPAPGQLTLAEAIHARTAALPDSTRAVLALVVASGGPISQELLLHASGIDGAGLARELTRLRLARLVRATGGGGRERVELAHSRIAEAVLRELTLEQERSLHATLARALETARSEDFRALARHWSAAGDHERAARYGLRAARLAENALAFESAARLYREVIAALGDDVTSEVYARYAEALSNAGHGQEGAEAYLAATELAGGAEALDLRRRAAEQLLLTGDVERGLAALKETLDQLGFVLPSSATDSVLRAMWRTAQLRMRGLDFVERDTTEIAATDLVRIDSQWTLFVGLASAQPLRAADALAQHLLLALRAGEAYRVGRGLAALGATATLLGGRRGKSGRGLLRRARPLAQRLQHPHLTALCRLGDGLSAFHGSDLAAAEQRLRDTEKRLRETCRGAVWELGTARFFHLVTLLQQGELRELSRRATRYAEDAQLQGDHYGLVGFTSHGLVSLALLDDRPEDVPELLSATQDDTPLHRFTHSVALTELGLYEGDLEATRRHMEAVDQGLPESRLSQLQWVRVELAWLRARVLLLSHDTEPEARKLRQVSRLANKLEREQGIGAPALAHALRAAVCARNDPSAAATLWLRAEGELKGRGRLLQAELDSHARQRALDNPSDLASIERALVRRGVKHPGRLARAWLGAPAGRPTEGGGSQSPA